jgi:ankyrin repeat protein
MPFLEFSRFKQQPSPGPAKTPSDEATENLFRAAISGSTSDVQKAIDAGARVNDHKNGWHRTPLHEAAADGRKDVACLLIANGADLNAPGEYGWTPSRTAFEYGNDDLARIIQHAAEKQAANPERRDDLKISPPRGIPSAPPNDPHAGKPRPR